MGEGEKGVGGSWAGGWRWGVGRGGKGGRVRREGKGQPRRAQTRGPSGLGIKTPSSGLVFKSWLSNLGASEPHQIMHTVSVYLKTWHANNGTRNVSQYLSVPECIVTGLTRRQKTLISYA